MKILSVFHCRGYKHDVTKSQLSSSPSLNCCPPTHHILRQVFIRLLPFSLSHQQRDSFCAISVFCLTDGSDHKNTQLQDLPTARHVPQAPMGLGSQLCYVFEDLIFRSQYGHLDFLKKTDTSLNLVYFVCQCLYLNVLPQTLTMCT